jgi:CheY-like chemotaxis protein
MLASWRMTPTTVPDATSALTLLRRTAGRPEQFDVVISDCRMPDVDGFTFARRLKRDPRLATTPVVMLTSIGHPREVVRCRKIGVDAYLSKPVQHSDLLDALVTVFGVSTRKSPSLARTTRARTRALRVLVAEDNLVNRKLVTRLLQKRGHRVTAVETGRAAVAALASPAAKRFDVVLMDVQMPEMNGLEATAAIRQREAAAGGHVPIIALTAHALQGDRERCLAAGMDAYLVKPIDVEEMISTVEACAEGGSSPPIENAATLAAGQLPLFDQGAALKHSGGDRRLLTEVVAFFRADYPSSLRQIGSAIKANDAERLRLSAHALKGALATVGSPAGRQAAFTLEQMGRAGEVDGAPEAFTALRETIVSLEGAFASADLVPRPRRRAKAPARRRTATSKRRLHDEDSRRRR